MINLYDCLGKDNLSYNEFVTLLRVLCIENKVILKLIGVKNMVRKLKVKDNGKNKSELSYLEKYLYNAEKIKKQPYSKLKDLINITYIKNPKILECITESKLESLEKKNTEKWLLLNLKTSLKDELKFYTALFSFFKDNLKMFIKLKNEFEHNFMNGSYENAKVNLEKMKKECGYSLWYIENKINLLELFGTPKIQKEYVRTIVDNEKNEFFVKFITYYCSYKVQLKNEKEFYSLINSLINCNESFLKDYSRYKFDYFNFFKVLENQEKILKVETQISIYDGYESIIKIFQGVLAEDQINKEEKKEIIEIIKIFIDEFEQLGDLRIRKMKEFISCEVIEKNDTIVECFDLYEKGKYEECFKICENILNKNILCYDIYDIYINVTIYLNKEIKYNKNSVFYKVMTIIIELKKSLKYPKESLQEIDNYLRCFSTNSWGTFLYYIKKFILKSYKMDITDVKYYQLNNIFYDIKNVKDIYQDNFLYLNIKKLYPKSITFLLIENFYNNKFDDIKKLEIPNERKIRYIAEGFYRIKNFEEVCLLDEEIKKLDIFSTTSILKCFILSHFYSGKVEEAIRILVEKYLQNKNLFIFLPLEEIIENLKLDEVKGEINIPIIYSIYSKEINELKSFEEYRTYEEFLYYYGYRKPSDLFEEENKCFDDEIKLNYFLENVCSLKNMQLSIEFESESEIIDERIKICKFLIYKNNNQKLISEIINLNKKKLIAQGINKLNEGKINLNIEEINKIMRERLEDRFVSYQLTKDLNSAIANELFEPLKLFEEETVEDIMETNNFLYQIILEARDIFILNDKFGLDTCLSTQIRHGIIGNAIRTVFEKLYLITKKDKNGNYLSNNYFLDTCELELEKETVDKLSQILNNTSKEIDLLSLSIKDKIIQISTERTASKEGLFDYIIYLDELTAWEEKIKKMESIEELIVFLNNEFLEKTRLNLEIIREYFDKIVLPKFINILNTILKEVTTLDSSCLLELKKNITLGK